jgi:alpha-glucosidase
MRARSLDGDAFRIYKTMPLDEHYFGLGDKTGPLDRRNEAFTLWNTDAYRFQESTDPLYKSIPYFMTFARGTRWACLLDNTWRTSFDFGKESLRMLTPSAPLPGPVDYYFFYGPSQSRWLKPMRGSRELRRCRHSGHLAFSSRAIATCRRRACLKLPIAFAPIDSGRCHLSRHRFQEKNRPFTVNKTAFPDLPGMIAQAQGGKLSRGA